MTRDKLPTCTKCGIRQAKGFLSIHTTSGEHVNIWATCYHCAELDGPQLDAEGMLVAFITPPTFERNI